MGFSLEDIGRLLEFREAPQEAKPDVRRLAGEKLAYVEEQLRELKILRDELTLLINLCATSEDGCAIIKGLEDD
jgi:MerR family copper efflux transcriptional regulator